MHIYFSGIGGAAIGPLALIAKQAGYIVSGSDARDSQYIHYLKENGIDDIHIGQTTEQIAAAHAHKPIDWLVYSSAVEPNRPELVFCQQNSIKATKRSEFLNEILAGNDLKLIAIAGTHGKTTTTAMAIWIFKQLSIPVSYSVGAKLSFGDMGEFDPKSQYFVYEADEYDRNFLAFQPHLSLISGIDWDHPDTFPTREGYYQAFEQFLDQSRRSFLWQDDADKLKVGVSDKIVLLDPDDSQIDAKIKLAGHVNRLDAWLAANALQKVVDKPLSELLEIISEFPGLSRRFEQIVPNLYSDYAHTPPKFRGALQLASELAGDNVVVVYEGIHNLRQHFIKDELADIFDNVKKLYIVPTYLGREDKSLKILTPTDLLDLLSVKSKEHAVTAELNPALAEKIRQHTANGDLVIGFSAGSGGSLDEWLRKRFS